MPIALQAVTLTGKTIEGGRWEVPSIAGLQEMQSFALNIPIKDKQLVSYLGKAQNADCMLDKDKDTYSVMLSFKVARIRHMLTTKDSKVDSMAVLVPVNRNVELVLQYLLNPAKTDPKFVKLIREAAGVSG